jgi:trimeric autotransporter adhesin
MKKITVLFFGALALSSGMMGQKSPLTPTILIDPTGDGGFENGGTFVLNNWVEVNDAVNKWYVGSPGVNAGTNGAYISDDGGVSNHYAPNVVTVSHFYKDIFIPSGENKITLQFNWKLYGESDWPPYWDYLRVFLISTTTTPVAGTQLTSGQIGGTYNLQNTWQTATIMTCLPSSGITIRLVFSWINNNNNGTQPPASVDNVSLTSEITSPLNGTYTIDNTQQSTSPMTTGGNFNSFTDAINYLNSDGISGSVIFNVNAGQTFMEDCPVLNYSGTATNTIVFRNGTGGANPVITATGGAGSYDAGITINGSDYITFDGIDIAVSGTVVEFGYFIKNANAGDGAQYNTIKNCKITLNRSNISTAAIRQSDYTDYTASATGASSYNTYHKNVIENSRSGILLSGYPTLYPSLSCIIDSNTVGASTADDIGSTGIGVSSLKDVQIFGNEIRNVTTAGSSNTVNGLWLKYLKGINNIYQNKIHDLSNTYIGASTGIVYGVFADQSDTINIYNNVLYGFNHGRTTPTTTQLIRVIACSLDGSSGTYNVYFNSARLDEDANPSSTVFYSGCSTLSNTDTFNVQNNIFANFSLAGATSKRYCWYHALGTVNSSNNLLYINTAGTGNNVGFCNFDQKTLHLFATYISAAAPAQGNESGSCNADPNFASTSDLTFAGSTSAANSGTPLPLVTVDFSGTTRDPSRPDIGAYETTQSQNDKSAPVLSNLTIISGLSPDISVTLTDNSSSSNNASIVLWYRAVGSGGAFISLAPDSYPSGAMNGTYTWNTSFSGLAKGHYEFYIAARDEQGAGQGIWINPMWASTFTGFSGSDPPNFTSNPDAGANKRTFVKTVSFAAGTYNVGASGNYTKLTTAAAAINTTSVTGPVVFELLSDYSSASETFPITFDEIYEVSATNTITVKPQAGVSATILGNSVSLSMFELKGTDYFILDGSNNGTTSRDLTISNPSTYTGSAAIWLESKGVNLGATNNCIKNCIIKCGITQNTATGVTYGIITAGSSRSISTGGADNDNNSYINNYIYKVRYGICSIGVSADNPNQNTTITENLIGPTEFGTDEIGKCGILMHNNNTASVSGNEIRFVGGDFANTSGGTDRVGIALAKDGVWPATGSTFASNIALTNNKIHDVIEERTYSSCAILVAGLNISGTTNTVANNVIYNIRCNGISNRQTAIIGIAYGNGDKVVFNSIFSTGDLDPGSATSTSNSSFGILVYATGVSNLMLKNNQVYVDFTSNTSTLYHAAISIPASYSWGTGGCDNNNYFTGTSSQMRLGYIGSIFYSDLASFRSIFDSDANSHSYNPAFTSTTDLALTASNNLGLPISGITTDYNGTARDAINPDLGAYENSTVVSSLTWSGTTDTDWNVFTNWNPSTTLPNPCIDVVIPNSSNIPALNSSAECKTLTTNSNGTVIISAGKTLIVNGNP